MKADTASWLRSGDECQLRCQLAHLNVVYRARGLRRGLHAQRDPLGPWKPIHEVQELGDGRRVFRDHHR